MRIFSSASLLLAAAVVLSIALGASSPPLAHAQLTWEQCQEESAWECTSIQVPMDYSAPDGEQIELGIARHAATNSDERIGTLFINFGGPGAPTIEILNLGLEQVFDPVIVEHFDLIGVDPRGVGRSSAIHCNQNIQDYYGADGTPDSEEEWQAIIDLAKEFAANCAENGEILAHIGTRNVVHDFEQARIALGEETISYLGFSYGTTIGQLYAEMYPESLRAVVLDGAYEYWRTDALLLQSIAFEGALDNFTDWCDETEECALFGSPEGSNALVYELLAQVEEAPIPAPGSDRDTHVGEATLGILGALYSESLWPDLAQAIADALDGDGTGLNDLADGYLVRYDDGTYAEDTAAYTAISCIDGESVDEEYFRTEAPKHREQAKLGGEDNLLKSILPCAYWEAEPDPLEGPVDGAGAPPILVISTTGDPATPYDQGVRIADNLESGILLTHVGEGHTVYLNGNPCVDNTVNDYLLDLALPNDGASCEPGADEPTGGIPPARTPTPTTPPATPTATTEPPTATPTPAPPTATATTPPPTATATAVPPTATPTRTAPMPPNSGSGIDGDADGRDWLLGFAAVLLALSAGALLVSHRK